MTRPALAAMLVSAAIGLGACGGSGSSPTVIRVLGMSIDRHSVEHWSTAIARGATPFISSGSSRQPRQQALGLLITADWLVGEAAKQGFRLSGEELARRARERSELGLDGGGEYRAALARVGETNADVELELKAQWAAAVVHHVLNARATQAARSTLTDAEVGSYYKAHLARYRISEVREFEIAEGFPSKAAATAFARQGTGRSSPFGRSALHETFSRPDRFGGPDGKGLLLRAIFAAKAGVISKPMLLNGRYVVFVLRHVHSASVKPFATVQGEIERELLARARARLYTQLLSAYARDWTAKTDCHSDYLTQQCRQYHGSPALVSHTYLATAIETAG